MLYYMISHNYGMADIEIMYPELVTRTVQKNRKKNEKYIFKNDNLHNELENCYLHLWIDIDMAALFLCISLLDIKYSVNNKIGMGSGQQIFKKCE